MKALWIFTVIFVFCLFVLYGLYLTEGLKDTADIVLTWLVYTILCITLVNIFTLGYFWSVVKDKRGPTGLRGPTGERGAVGQEGQCNISSTSAFLLQAINEYLDALYKAKTNNNILDTDTQTFTNRYINDKIRTMIASRQYQSIINNLKDENKTIEGLTNYIKSIWKIWFDLIFDATTEPGVWFTDEYGDEEYNWSGSNPFDEIKKYDLYYWGVTRDFRPLRAELCRTKPDYLNSKLPYKNKNLGPKLKIIQTNDYRFLGSDKESGGSPDASFWRAKAITIGKDTYYPVGDITTAGARDEVWKNNYGKKNTIVDEMQYDIKPSGPVMRTILVAGDVKDPIGSKMAGESGGIDNIQNFKLECPEGYVSMGDYIETDYLRGRGDLKCVPKKCVEKIEVPKSKQLWFGPNWKLKGLLRKKKRRQGMPHWALNDYNTDQDDANGDNSYNLYRLDKAGPFYKIKQSCLEYDIEVPTKDVEPQFGDLGIGWYGHPYKLEPQYSIFTFLNLVPEGIIVHKGTGRRFYIMHYGGEDANVYNVLDYDDEETKKFTKAFQVDSNKNNNGVVSRDISRSDSRQQYKIVFKPSNKKQFTLKNLMNGKSLYLGLEPLQGDSQFSTVDLNKWQQHPVFGRLTQEQIDDGTTFSFISSFGTNMDIIDKGRGKKGSQ